MPGKRVSKDTIQLVYFHHHKGKSAREIADMLSIKIRTVYNIIYRAEKDGRLELKKPTGRPKKVTEIVESQILNTFNDKPQSSSRELALQMGIDYGLSVSHQTILNVLQKSTYTTSQEVKKKPLLLVQNIEKRLKFATEFIALHPDYWTNVIFSDETKIRSHHNDETENVWQKSPTAEQNNDLNPTENFEKLSVMVWGCISSKGVGEIRIMDKMATDEIYLDILKNELTASVQKFGFVDPENINKCIYKYYQGNDSRHKSDLCRSWLLHNCPKVIDTPAQNADINPINDLWVHVKKKIEEKSPTNKNELIKYIKEEWEKITLEYDLLKLVYSMPSRLQAVIDAKGKHTEY